MEIVKADEYLRDIKGLYARHPEATFAISSPHLLILVGVMQLALRHPRLPDAGREVAMRFIESVKETLREYPALTKTIEQGFDPACDVGTEEKSL